MQGAIASYQTFLEDMFGDALNYDYDLKTKDINGVAIIVWGTVMAEMSHLLKCLSCYSMYDLFEKQRLLYFQARFCMEAVADLNCMMDDTSQVKNFYGGANDYLDALSIMRSEDDNIEKSSKVANLLKYAGHINPNTSERIKNAFPLQVQEYSILCYHTHLNAIGMLHELREDKESVISDLMYQCFDVVSSSLIKMLLLVKRLPTFNIDQDSVDLLVKKTQYVYSLLSSEAQ